MDSKSIRLGRRFHFLKVIGYPLPICDGFLWYPCRCKCGKEIKVRDDRLRNGRTKSCGCWRKVRMKQMRAHYAKERYGNTTQRNCVSKYRYNAKRAGREFSLTIRQCVEIMSKPCAYCGTPPSHVFMGFMNEPDFVHGGIDRIDSSKGYTIDNVSPCCWRCNRCKSNLSLNEFLGWIAKVYNHAFSTPPGPSP